MKIKTVIIGSVLLGGLITAVAAYLASPIQHHSISHLDPSAAEILTLSVAIENYKTDHGHYPTDPATTERLDPNGLYHPATYEAAGAFLYRALSGADEKDKKNYLATFPRKYVSPNKNGVARIVDPWGNPLGYSTLKAIHPSAVGGNNPTFDLWSTGKDETQSKQAFWVKNW